jgi:hypothetical protein
MNNNAVILPELEAYYDKAVADGNFELMTDLAMIDLERGLQNKESN